MSLLQKGKWVKGSGCAVGESCVEVMRAPHGEDGPAIAMRDGKNPTGAQLNFTRRQWDAFVAGVRGGEFDL